ncbi:hypothetical protein NL676_002849 [Syzygium grande]|nr:hypothetical protein NL676_002849 [Syzygium grande]
MSDITAVHFRGFAWWLLGSHEGRPTLARLGTAASPLARLASGRARIAGPGRQRRWRCGLPTHSAPM